MNLKRAARSPHACCQLVSLWRTRGANAAGANKQAQDYGLQLMLPGASIAHAAASCGDLRKFYHTLNTQTCAPLPTDPGRRGDVCQD